VRLLLPCLLAACAPGGMSRLHAPPQELAYAIDPACEVGVKDGQEPPEPGPDVDCKEERRRGMTRRAQAGLFTDMGAEDPRIRLVFLGDAGVRQPDDPSAVGDGPAAVHEHARRVCGGTCDGVVLLGDNIYQHGVNSTVDSDFLRAFATLWSDVGPQFYVSGNHDWGTYPIIKPPRLDRAQRELGELRRLADQGLDVRGDSHFWATTVGEGRLVGLDTNYLVRACRTRGERGVKCAGDPGRKDQDQVSFLTLVEGLTTPGTGPTVVVGHHPWLSHGEHGQAGAYWDYDLFGVFPVGMGPARGAALRRVLDQVVAPNAAVYLSGHDHNTQVARIDPSTLAVVVGAGGKVTGPGKHTGPGGDRALDGIEAEHFCDLGYAVLTITQRELSLQVHTLPAPIAVDKDRKRVEECLAHRDKRRPGEEWATAPTCTSWTWSQRDGTVGTWSEPSPCPAVQ